MANKNPNQTKARLMVIVVFVMGLAIGALSMNLYQRSNSTSPEINRFHSGRPPQERILQDMVQRLKLSDDQQNQIKAILDNTFTQYRLIRQEMEPKIKEFNPRFDAARLKGREEIRKVLSAEQLPGFEEMTQEFDRRRQEMDKRRDYYKTEPKPEENK